MVFHVDAAPISNAALGHGTEEAQRAQERQAASRQHEGLLFDLLLLGFYELLITEVSPHVVNEWVSLLGSKQNVKGFVNALLRKAAITNFDEMAAKLSEGLEEQAALSITTSHPFWIVQKY